MKDLLLEIRNMCGNSQRNASVVVSFAWLHRRRKGGRGAFGGRSLHGSTRIPTAETQVHLSNVEGAWASMSLAYMQVLCAEAFLHGMPGPLIFICASGMARALAGTMHPLDTSWDGNAAAL